MTRLQIPVTRGNAGDDGDSVEFDLTSDSKKVQAVGLRRSDDNKELVAADADGMLVNLGANNDVDVASIAAGSNLIGKVDHATTGIGDGRKVTVSAGTSVALASSTAAKWVTVTAETDNSGVVVVGGSTVVAALATRRGIPLMAGDSCTLPIDDLADVYIDSTVSGDGVTFTYGTDS